MKEIKVGSIVATDYYGCPHAFKVIKTTAKTALCKELNLKVTSDDGYGQNGTCVPVENEFKDNPYYGEIMCRIKDSSDGDQYLVNKKESLCLFQYGGRPLHYYTD